jgi:uridine kinase
MIKENDKNQFFQIEEGYSLDSLYIGSIQTINHFLVTVELKNSGSYWISSNTIEKLVSILDSEYKPKKKTDYLLTSYFIMKRDLVGKLFVLSAIDTLLMKENKVNIAIDGNASSGKTTFSKQLEQIYDCNVFHMDNYFQKSKVNPADELSYYASNISFERIKKEILEPIYNEKPSVIQKMDLRTHTLLEPETIPYKKISIIEGAYSMHPYIIEQFDLKVFMKASYFKQIKRIYQRNGFKKLIQFLRKWIPMENRYFKNLEIESKSDIILRKVK